MGNLAKDTTEMDLWAFDDLDSPTQPISPVLTLPTANALPAPRDPERIKNRLSGESGGSKSEGNESAVRIHANKPRPPTKAGSSSGQAKPGRDFDDLDSLDGWEEPEAEVIKIDPETETPAVSAPSVGEAIVDEAAVDTPISQPLPPAAENDEFSPPVRKNVAPVSLKPRLNLSKVERIGLVALVALLLAGGVVAFLLTINRLPSASEFGRATDFPLQGKHFAILGAETYWRAPLAGDTARRGTQLVPVVKFKINGGPGAIRIVFRDSAGETVGDTVIRTVKSGGDLEISATAGFDDVGMYAAYHTGLSKPWTIDVSEAPSESALGTDFTKLFVTNISPDRR
jgi:hypothetical protein